MSEEEETMPTKRTGRGGVEVRVIGGGMGDPRRGVAEPGEWVEWEDLERTVDGDEVVRLDGGSRPLANRRLEDEELLAAGSYGSKKGKMGLGRLTLLMAGLAVILTVAVVSIEMALREEPPGRMAQFESLRVVEGSSSIVDDSDDLPSSEDYEKLAVEAAGLIKAYGEVEKVEDVIGLVRNGEQLKPMLDQRWKPMEMVEKMTAEVSNPGGREIVTVFGETTVGDAFGMICVSTEGVLKVDWEASMAVGDVEFDALKGIDVGRTVTMRVVLQPATFYPLEFSDDEYRSYRVLSPGWDIDIFAYARLESDVVEMLSSVMKEDSVLFRKVSDVAAIVGLRNSGRGEAGQFVIEEIKQVGWIEP